jgi:hypothetical protein
MRKKCTKRRKLRKRITRRGGKPKPDIPPQAIANMPPNPINWQTDVTVPPVLTVVPPREIHRPVVTRPVPAIPVPNVT